MSKRFVILFSLLVFSSLLAGCALQPQSQSIVENVGLEKSSSPSPASSPVSTTAQFEIYTNGTKRIFTQSMYHRQSPDVYIESADPSIVHVKKQGVTWSDFFETLPFSLTKNCLVTGTKQTFCSNETQKLRFFLNGGESPDALDYEIGNNDVLKITYGS